jgi:hypothetical protein
MLGAFAAISPGSFAIGRPISRNTAVVALLGSVSIGFTTLFGSIVLFNLIGNLLAIAEETHEFSNWVLVHLSFNLSELVLPQEGHRIEERLGQFLIRKSVGIAGQISHEYIGSLEAIEEGLHRDVARLSRPTKLLKQLVLILGIEMSSGKVENGLAKGVNSLSCNRVIEKDLLPLLLENCTHGTRKVGEQGRTSMRDCLDSVQHFVDKEVAMKDHDEEIDLGEILNVELVSRVSNPPFDVNQKVLSWKNLGQTGCQARRNCGKWPTGCRS